MQMCMNPTPSQRVTLEAIAKENRIEFGEEACRRIEKYYINDKPDHRESLYLPRLNLTDLSPIGYLLRVDSINIEGNRVRDISPLAKLTNLKQLNLSYNPITDIEPLKKLVKLERLTLFNDSVLDISPLKHLTTLKYLGLSGKKKNLEVVSHLITLEDLTIIDTDIENVCQLNSLTNLSSIFLSRNGVMDINCLDQLTQLKTVDIHNPIRNISVFAKYPELRSIDISKTQVESVEALIPLQHISSLIIDHTNITDLSPISGRDMGLFSAEGAPLRWCSPKTGQEIIDGVSCYEKDGTLKSWWKRLLRQ